MTEAVHLMTQAVWIVLLFLCAHFINRTCGVRTGVTQNGNDASPTAKQIRRSETIFVVGAIVCCWTAKSVLFWLAVRSFTAEQSPSANHYLQASIAVSLLLIVTSLAGFVFGALGKRKAILIVSTLSLALLAAQLCY